MNPTDAIRILAVIEADTVTGPAKNLIEFAALARQPALATQGLLPMKVSIATFQRQDSSNSRDRRANHFVQSAREAGIEVEVIDERFRFDTQVVADLAKVIREQRPQVVQTHGVKSHFLMRLLGRWRSIPWIAFHHGYTAPDLKMRAYNKLDRWSLPYASRVVTMNRGFERELTRAGVDRKRVRIVHNAIARDWLDRFASRVTRDSMRGEMRQRFGVPDDAHLILSVGRLSREKGHSDLIEAFDLLSGAGQSLNSRLLFAGEGPERGRLERAAASRGLQERVIFAGHLEDVAPYYAAADLFALPSHTEGSPNALLEAMGARLPVVATRLNGVSEIASHRVSALLVPPRAPWHLAAGIHSILSAAELSSWLARNAGRTVQERFTHEARFRSLAALYSELVGDDVKRSSRVA